LWQFPGPFRYKTKVQINEKDTTGAMKHYNIFKNVADILAETYPI
jgi:hypothetical protein